MPPVVLEMRPFFHAMVRKRRNVRRNREAVAPHVRGYPKVRPCARCRGDSIIAARGRIVIVEMRTYRTRPGMREPFLEMRGLMDRGGYAGSEVVMPQAIPDHARPERPSFRPRRLSPSSGAHPRSPRG